MAAVPSQKLPTTSSLGKSVLYCAGVVLTPKL